MNDQARLLREQIVKHRLINPNEVEKEAKTIAIISGKGGVGKSNFSLNFSLSLQQRGFNVLLFDLDIGMANIDILMGTTQKYSIVHLFEGGRNLNQIIQKGPENLSYIAGGSGLTDIFKLDEQKRKYFLSQLAEATYQYDFIIFDMGAGITEESLQLLLAVDEICLLTTCEPTSITDAYSALKYINIQNPSIPFHLILNKVPDLKIAAKTAERLQSVAKQFLTKKLNHLGSIPDDRAVLLAVMDQTPFILKNPNSPASKAIFKLSTIYLDGNSKAAVRSHEKTSFVSKLFRLFT
ncbi:MinD/ParA family protein [Sutcliffiella halmapala]|uniref:MinD/ParA family protein n=1 Tax=Sutcliffiella halmapala TaxID=79882 RepID=UPI00099508BD|nr:MinD/ParA family protein [Sutcliffiella halmapala]